MKRTFRTAAALLVSIAAASVGCNYDGSSAPRSVNLTRGDRAIAALDIQLMSPAERTTPLEADVVWSFSAGPDGAVSSNAVAGLTIVVPAGALSTTQTISVTALAGNHVAYRFEPHLEFGTKVRLVQNLWMIRAPWLGLAGGHFGGDSPEFATSVVRITESVPAIISILDGTLSFQVQHFSGWIVGGNNESPPPQSGSSQ